MSNNEIDPCLDCSIRYMREQGCCTQDVGEGTKRITNGFRVIEVCRQLVVNDGPTYCGIHGMHPYECKAFRCPKKIMWDAQHGGR